MLPQYKVPFSIPRVQKVHSGPQRNFVDMIDVITEPGDKEIFMLRGRLLPPPGTHVTDREAKLAEVNTIVLNYAIGDLRIYGMMNLKLNHFFVDW